MSILKCIVFISLGLMSAGCATTPDTATPTSAIVDGPKYPAKKAKSTAPAEFDEPQITPTEIDFALTSLPVSYVEVDLPTPEPRIAKSATQIQAVEVPFAPSHRATQPVHDDPKSRRPRQWVEQEPPSAPLALREVAANPPKQGRSLVASLAPVPIEALPMRRTGATLAYQEVTVSRGHRMHLMNVIARSET